MSPLVFRQHEEQAQAPERPLAALLQGHRPVLGACPGPAATGGPHLVFDADAWLSLRRGAAVSHDSEQVGVFYGEAFSDRGQDWLWIHHAIHAAGAPSTAVHVQLNPAAWEVIHREARRIGCQQQAVVGWWHTHPDLGAFFSGTDRGTQSRAFPRPWQVGLVMDPVRREVAAFRGGDSQQIQLPIMVVDRSPIRWPDVPAEAVGLPLDPQCRDLATAAFDALVKSHGPLHLMPVPHPLPCGWSGLIFDRPGLKRRHPAAAAALAGTNRTRHGWQVNLSLSREDVACVAIRGVFRPAHEWLDRSVL